MVYDIQKRVENNDSIVNSRYLIGGNFCFSYSFLIETMTSHAGLQTNIAYYGSFKEKEE